jgi:hypothetical protein
VLSAKEYQELVDEYLDWARTAKSSGCHCRIPPRCLGLSVIPHMNLERGADSSDFLGFP